MTLLLTLTCNLKVFRLFQGRWYTEIIPAVELVQHHALKWITSLKKKNA